MSEKRRFHRVRVKGKGVLRHNNIIYPGELELISMNGATISLRDNVIIPQNDESILTLCLEGDNMPLTLTVKIVHSNLMVTGMKFTSTDTNIRYYMFQLIDKLTTKQDKLPLRSYHS